MIDRRNFLHLSTGLLGAGAAISFYGVVIEPFFRLRVTRYSLSPPQWPRGRRLRCAVIADLHACDPWMRPRHIAEIVTLTNRLEADCILLLGDFVATYLLQKPLPLGAWVRELTRLEAPLGVHAVLGNHDWWADPAAVARGSGLPDAGKAIQDTNIRLYQNDVLRLVKDNEPFWLAGLGDQLAFGKARTKDGQRRYLKLGMDDLAGTMAQITDDAPIIMMAHEPDIFPQISERVALTISGHTHGGQINLFGWRPVVPSRYGSRYVYGHITETVSNRDDQQKTGRHMIVSGGLGCSGIPVRIGAPPEIVLIDLE